MTDKKVEIATKLNDSRHQLMALFEGLDEAAWETAVYDEGVTWTIADILRHLVDSEKGMTNMITQWQQDNDPIPSDFDLVRWNNRAVEKMAQKSPQELLQQMEINRANLLNVIDTLQEDDWGKQGRHASLRIMSIAQVCHLIADHETSHRRVIEATLATNQ